MDNIVVRTDLAVEANEEAMNGTGKLRGIRLRESNKSRMGVKVTELQVTNHLGEAAIGRPKGTYLTIEADDITGGDEEYAKEVISTLTGYIFKLLKRMNKNVKPEKILHGQGGQSVILTPGKFLVAFPEDAHKTCGMIEIPQKFIKAVYKIRL